MRLTSALIEGNTCPELCGDQDKFGNIYAGPRCNGCEQCAGLEPIKLALRSGLPYKPCFIIGHTHQMALCGGCSKSGFRNGTHWYCPDLTYKSGDHVSAVGATAPLIEEDIPDEALV